MWTLIIPVLSTAHIKETTISALRGDPLLCAYDNGAFLFIGNEDNQARLTELAPELLPVIAWFYSEHKDDECGGWIRFDCDGDQLESLPTYDW